MRALLLLIETTSGWSPGNAQRRCRRSVGRRANHSAMMRRLIDGFAENSIVTIPLHHPVPGFSLPVANKRRLEARHSPIVCRGGGKAANLPAGLRGAGFARRIMAQQKSGDVFVLGREYEPA